MQRFLERLDGLKGSLSLFLACLKAAFIGEDEGSRRAVRNGLKHKGRSQRMTRVVTFQKGRAYWANEGRPIQKND